MAELDIIDLYNEKRTGADAFAKEVDSTMRVQTDYNKTIEDKNWVEMMEETIPHIDHIFRNPNRFIINEEEIVKIEMAKKITVESIKHLSRNTNLIQEYDEKNNDIRPSKILNINKEESFDTYENRLIYTLVQNMKAYIARKKKYIEQRDDFAEKNDKKIEYKGTSKIKNELVDINISLNSRIEGKSSKQEMLDRIAKLETKLKDLTFLETYKIIDKKHITLVQPPIRKTNVVLKNVHFQYAVKLWNYMADNVDDKTEIIKDKQDYEDKTELKSLVDETFLMNYLVASTLDKDKPQDDEERANQQDIINKTTDSMLQKIAELNSNLTEEEFKEMIAKKFAIVKYKTAASLAEIQQVFKEHINSYLKQIN